MILDFSSATHKLTESNQRFRLANGPRPPVSSHSIHSTSYSGDYSAMGAHGFGKSSTDKGSVSGAGSAGASSPEAPGRDSHDLQLNLGNGRESLVDNLLLSFDKIGDTLGTSFETSPYFSAVDEMDDDDDDSASNYSQQTGPPPTARGRSSSNYYVAPFAGGPANYGNRRVGSFDNGTESFGANFNDNRRETRSRGRGVGSSHGFANTYDPFDAAPPPSIRSGPRNRTPSPPRSPRLVRRPSNRSIRSPRRDQQQFNPHFEDPISLPPLPAFVNPTIMPSKTPQKQGFFRRVLGIGGGGTGSGTGSGSNSVISKQQSNPTPREPSQPPYSSDSPHSTINKKPSFFRRRKKSVSDAMSQAVLPIPLHTTEPISPIEYPTQSPSTSLSAVMNPYLRSPVKSSTFDVADDDEHEHAYLQRGATIRTVASSDPISPKRPTFFGESLRGRDSGSHYGEDYSAGSRGVYRKDTRYVRGAGGNGDLGLQTSPPRDREDWDRPQTSPYTSTFARGSQSVRGENEQEREMRWPPVQRSILTTRRSVDNVALERERHERERHNSTSSMNDNIKSRQGSVVSREMPIATVQELDAHHAKTDKIWREGIRGKPLEVDTKMGATSMLGVRGPENSWLSTPTPATAGTPTVMLQRDGPGEKAKPLEEEDEVESSDDEVDIDVDCEEPSEETWELARKVFEGDEEVIPKAGVTSWLGDA